MRVLNLSAGKKQKEDAPGQTGFPKLGFAQQ
jgi:hypothetical protein